MSKKQKNKKKIGAVTILREKLSSDSVNQLDRAAQKKVLEVYCRNNHISIETYHLADESFVHWADFKLFLKEIKTGSFRPSILLFTSWEIIAPLLDRFPQTFKILADKDIKMKSIKNNILKHALNK